MVLTRILNYILSGMNIFLHMVVNVYPSWTMYRPYTSPILVGLWVVCSNEYGCHAAQMDEVNLNVVRGFMATALLFSFIALVWSVEWDIVVHCDFIFVPKALVSSIFNFFAGTCVLVALLVFQFSVIMQFEEVPHIRKWAFYLSIAICGLSFLTGTLDLLSYKYMLWGTGSSPSLVAPEEETEEQLEKQNAQVPRLI